MYVSMINIYIYIYIKGHIHEIYIAHKRNCHEKYICLNKDMQKIGKEYICMPS
jgi:hypothetical protein